MIGNMYNVNIKWSIDGSAPSGFSLLVQNIDLLESREDDIEYAESYEKEIYDVIQVQDDILGLGNKLPVRDKNNKLYVDFQEVNFPVNAAEEREKWDWEIEKNAKTIVDYIQSDQGLTDEEAMERYEENKKINTNLTPRQQALREAFTVEPENTTE
jgi:hypothetical protein